MARKRERKQPRGSLLLWLPDLDGVIFAGGGDQFAVGGPGHGFDTCGVLGIRDDLVACNGVPNLHCFIVAARGDESPIGRPHKCVDWAALAPVRMPLIGVDGASSSDMPNLYGFIVAGRSDECAVR